MNQIPEAVFVMHKAIENEKEALQHYLLFAKLTKDPKAKNVLINLANDEVGHMTKLEHHLTQLLAGKGGVLSGATTTEAIAAVMTKSAKLEEFDKAALEKADEIRILELAVDKEIKANQEYLALAAQAGSAEAKAFFLSLAQEEELHAKILRAEIDALGQDGFWFDMQEFTMEQ